MNDLGPDKNIEIIKDIKTNTPNKNNLIITLPTENRRDIVKVRDQLVLKNLILELAILIKVLI